VGLPPLEVGLLVLEGLLLAGEWMASRIFEGSNYDDSGSGEVQLPSFGVKMWLLLFLAVEATCQICHYGKSHCTECVCVASLLV
jgi:hypothetical protein